MPEQGLRGAEALAVMFRLSSSISTPPGPGPPPTTTTTQAIKPMQGARHARTKDSSPGVISARCILKLKNSRGENRERNKAHENPPWM